ncbi:unnamed protein product [Gongylonema pulchrum]|uniref:Transposase n=1 Tax=Gongylonema pulchrum TaxID=637853 RepID=A0A183DN81_9BILA|nr:unnamed protein product [Gongylonema pulchrum]
MLSDNPREHRPARFKTAPFVKRKFLNPFHWRTSLLPVSTPPGTVRTRAHRSRTFVPLSTFIHARPFYARCTARHATPPAHASALRALFLTADAKSVTENDFTSTVKGAAATQLYWGYGASPPQDASAGSAQEQAA